MSSEAEAGEAAAARLVARKERREIMGKWFGNKGFHVKIDRMFESALARQQGQDFFSKGCAVF